MNYLTRKLLVLALAASGCGGALAREPVYFGPAIGPVAEASAEERAWFRERWRQMPVEERDAMRRKLQQEWSNLPPEARQEHRQKLFDQLEERRERVVPRFDLRPDEESGYGQGFGTRIWRGGEDESRRGRR